MSRRLLDGLLAASLLTMTWAKIHWQAGSLDLTIGNITASAFLAAFLIDRLQRRDDALPRPAITLCGFGNPGSGISSHFPSVDSRRIVRP